MDEGDVADLELAERLCCQRLHLLQRHFFVGFVVEVESLAAAGLVANYAFENDGGTIFSALACGECLVGVAWIAADRGAYLWPATLAHPSGLSRGHPPPPGIEP